MSFPSGIAFWIGSWPVRWYGLSYGVGIILAWVYVRLCVKKGKFAHMRLQDIDEFINWGIVGIILGGRLGNVFFYYPSYYWHHLAEIPKVWHGGMSFHGGLLGVVVALCLYARYKKLSFMELADCWACAAPIGLFFGRLANFINQELYGRVSSGWGIVFPLVDQNNRHPSQLYEAGLEGVFLFVWLALALWKKNAAQRPGQLSGIFLLGYGLTRWIGEYFREPLEMSYFAHMSMGQLYSVPLMIIGYILYVRSRHFSRHQSQC